MTRGIKHDVDRFITELQGKYLPYEYAKGEKALVQFSVRPIQLWEFVFPEEHLQTVMKTLFDDTTTRNKGFSYAKRNDKYLWALRTALNSQKFPKITPDDVPMPVYKNNIEIEGIGIKKDIFDKGIEKL